MVTFEEFELSEELYKAIARLGFKTPTQIQEKSIPLILQGKDILGESATGSGKTLAFGCGVVEKSVQRKGLQSLILAPTRELAEQVKNDLKQFSSKLKILSIYGGVSIDPQIKGLQTAEVVVATPGRLKDHLQRGTIDLSKIKVLVLDEADRMLDMGFIEDIEYIIDACPKNRQTLLFSATIPHQIERLSQKYLKNPAQVFAEKEVDPTKLKQIYYDVHKGLKLSLLVHLIRNESSNLVMVFCNTRWSTDLVAKNLKANGIKAIAIHGGFAQNKRSRTIEMFDCGKVNVLVCTDVAARGLHIEGISHVYNYEIPNDPNDYVHRIGRTARAGEEGKVINLICDKDYDNFSRVMDTHRSFVIERVDKPYIEKVAFIRDEPRRRFPPRRGHGPRRSHSPRRGHWGL